MLEHINKNLKEYIIVTLVFFIGLLFGVMLVNNISENNNNEISGYISNFIELLKNQNYEIDKFKLFKISIWDNIKLVTIIWLLGSTIIGIPLIYALVTYRGFCLGYAISCVISVLGAGKGTLFSVATMLLQNIIFIPALLILSVSAIKLYKSIIKDRRKSNIKLEICRHSIISLFLIMILIIESIVEAYISTEIVMLTMKIL